MASHGSATAHKQTPHVIQTTRTTSASNALKRRAQTVLNENDSNDGASEGKLERLIETICGASEESAAAILVLIGMFENSAHPNVLANTAKHLAFTHCGELNLYGMVDAQIAVVERELWPVDPSGPPKR